MSPPILPVLSIPDDGMELPVALDAAWLRGALEDTGFSPRGDGPTRVLVRLDRDKRDVVVSGHFDIALHATCVACLEPFDLRVEGDLQLVLEPKPKAPTKAHEEIELKAAELDVDYYEDDQIDLGRWLREAILVEAPVHPRHEGQCPVPLTAVTDHPERDPGDIDPRLLPLLKLSVPQKE